LFSKSEEASSKEKEGNSKGKGSKFQVFSFRESRLLKGLWRILAIIAPQLANHRCWNGAGARRKGGVIFSPGAKGIEGIVHHGVYCSTPIDNPKGNAEKSAS
jgi:hypothetical protein